MATEHPSVCTLDCPDTCSLTVTVEDGPHRQGPRLDGAALHRQRRSATRSPTTRRVRPRPRPSCTSAAPRRPARLRAVRSHRPGTRRWTASGSASSVIDRWGPQAVMPLNYAGPHGMLAGDSMSLRFFHKLGASQLFRRLSVRRRAQRGLGRHLRRRCRASGPRRRQRRSSTSCGATTPPSPTCTLSARPASRGAMAADW